MSGTPRTRPRRPSRAQAPSSPDGTPPVKRSDLGARIAVAIPALGFALAIVLLGGWWFTAGAAALAIVCAHEFFRMYEPIHPVRMAASSGSSRSVSPRTPVGVSTSRSSSSSPS